MTAWIEPPFWATRESGRRPLHSVSAVVTQPSVEPVSLTQVRNRLHLDPALTEEERLAQNTDLSGLILAARQQVEKDLGEACLVPTVIDHYLDRVPTGRILTLPRWPLQSVASVKSYDLDDVVATLASGDYLVDTASRPGRVILNGDASWPSALRYHQGVVVRHTSGFSGVAKAVSSLTRSGGLVTFTTAAPHGLSTGQHVMFTGATQTDYNGTVEVEITGLTTGTYTVSGTPATPATGTITAADLGIPACYTLAMMTLIAHWHLNREAVLTGTISKAIEWSYEALLSDAPVSLV